MKYDEIPRKRATQAEDENYKCPLNITILASKPEIEFAKEVCERGENEI